MQNFIVLGYIPGTQIQINFVGWLVIVSIFCVLTLVVFKLHTLINWFIARQLLHYIKHQPLSNLAL